MDYSLATPMVSHETKHFLTWPSLTDDPTHLLYKCRADYSRLIVIALLIDSSYAQMLHVG